MKQPLKKLLLTLLLLTLSIGLALEITFLDVGQGASVLIKAPTGQVALYDAGTLSSNVAAQLGRLGVTSLGLVIASHGHADHIGGMADVITAFKPTFYLDNGIPHTTATYERTLRAAQAAGSQLLEPTRRTINLGDVRLTVIPPPGVANYGQNDNSVGLRIEYGEFTATLPGDAEARQWAWWLNNHPDLLTPVNVHLASHHGSRNGDTHAGVTALQPDLVIITLGSDNTYGHPHAEALNLYRNSTVLRTDTHGQITIKANPDGQYKTSTTRTNSTPAPQANPPAPTAPATVAPTRTAATCVNINHASSTDLQQIIHIGPARATSIISLRAQAPFRTVSDLTRVSGIGAARIADIHSQGTACTQ